MIRKKINESSNFLAEKDQEHHLSINYETNVQKKEVKKTELTVSQCMSSCPV